MRTEFYEIYRHLSNSYVVTRWRYGIRAAREHGDRRRWIRRGPFWIDAVIRRSDAQAEAEGRPRLRPDARLFLLTNLWEIVMLPILSPRNTLPVDVDEVRHAITEDVQMLISAAQEVSAGKKEITGGDMVKVTAERWDHLQINALRFWGARDNAS